MKNIGVILAAGNGLRFGGKVPKQFIMLQNKAVLRHSVETFMNAKNIDELVLIVNKNYIENYLEIIKLLNYTKELFLVAGGETRQESVKKAIDYLATKNEEAIVLVHDAARPFVTERIINDNIEGVKNFICCTTAIPCRDSVYLVNDGKFAEEIKRDRVYLAQTPQSSYLSIFKKALDGINEIYTDDAALFAKLGYVPHIVPGDSKNVKITFPEDIKE